MQLSIPLWVGQILHVSLETPREHTYEAFDTAPYRRLCPHTSYVRAAGRDPASMAMAEAGAVHVDQGDFCVLNVRGQVVQPLSNSHFSLYRLPGRRIRGRRNINCLWGMRLWSQRKRRIH